MRVEVYPSRVSGRITPPASKSYLHRAIICASLSFGKSRINNVVYSDDVKATLGVFENLGVHIEKHKDYILINSNGFEHFQTEKVVYCNESGSTIRFLIPVLSNDYNTVFKGKSGLMKRPFTVYEDIFVDQNLTFNQDEEKIITKGSLKPGNYEVTGNISSQFISGLLFILPTLNGDSTIKVTGNFESEEYVDMTVSIMNLFNVKVEKNGQTIFVPGNQKYSPTDINAEIDYSQMAFFAVLGIINNTVTVDGIKSNSLQPDRRITHLIKEMGGLVKETENSITFFKSKTEGISIDMSQSPDLAPILGVLGACSKNQTKLTNAKRLVIKESNRLLTTYETLKNLGVGCEMGSDYLIINGCNLLKGNEFDSYNDHRIAMMLGIAGTVCDSKVVINNAEAINKSYPDFFKDLQSLGVRVKYL